MSDILGRMAAIFITVIAVVFLPILVLSLKMENTTRSMIETYVTQFVDNARTTGKITPEEYEKTYANILRCQDYCSFQMTHSSRMYAPDDGMLSDQNAVAYYSDFNNQDILDVMYKSYDDKNIPYEMRNGDYLTVTVKNERPTFATRLYRLIVRSNGNDTSIYVNYGGLVGNYIEEPGEY